MARKGAGRHVLFIERFSLNDCHEIGLGVALLPKNLIKSIFLKKKGKNRNGAQYFAFLAEVSRHNK